ncbi:MAG: H/ACA ribonucleoprotein complex subunit GAR1 [Candidatus Heimdallarchaeota archaeon]
MRLGNSLHIISQNLLILRAEEPLLSPKKIELLISMPVVDKNLKEIGTISDVFGPVEKPFVVVQLKEKQIDVEKLLEQKFYFIPKQRRTKSRTK